MERIRIIEPIAWNRAGEVTAVLHIDPLARCNTYQRVIALPTNPNDQPITFSACMN